jgi:hypothetical protein
MPSAGLRHHRNAQMYSTFQHVRRPSQAGMAIASVNLPAMPNAQFEEAGAPAATKRVTCKGKGSLRGGDQYGVAPRRKTQSASQQSALDASLSIGAYYLRRLLIDCRPVPLRLSN